MKTVIESIRAQRAFAADATADNALRILVATFSDAKASNTAKRDAVKTVANAALHDAALAESVTVALGLLAKKVRKPIFAALERAMFTFISDRPATDETAWPVIRADGVVHAMTAADVALTLAFREKEKRDAAIAKAETLLREAGMVAESQPEAA